MNMTRGRDLFMTSDELHLQVKDRETFIAYVEALAEEREEAQRIEQANPLRYSDGALGWKNADISSFLYAALYYFHPKPLRLPESEPSWRMFADFLYCGKIIE
jgi:hypothetical protein